MTASSRTTGTTEPAASVALTSTPAWRRWAPVLIPLGITLAAGALRFVRLESPNAIMDLDEGHYVPEARTFPAAAPGVGMATPHPPLGKLLIKAGINVFGDNPFGWRAGSALVGTLGVLFLYLLARRLWSSPALAALAATLLAVEGLWFVQSRIAMLDIYAATFTLCGVWLLFEDRARAGPEHRGPRWWRIGSGVAFGLALASKTSIAPYLLAAMVAAVAWELSRLDRDPAFIGIRRSSRRSKARALRQMRQRYARTLGKQTLAIAGTFVVIPFVVYVASYASWFASPKRDLIEPCRVPATLMGAWWCTQQWTRSINAALPEVEDGRLAHPYLTKAWSWPWIGRPILHHLETRGRGDERRAGVLGLPNPVIWWPAFLVGLPLLGWHATRRKDETATLLFLLILVGYLPYLIGGAFGHAVYLYYATPVVPFLVLGVVYVIHRVARQVAAARVLFLGYTALSLTAFAFFYPALAGVSLPQDGPLGTRARTWITVDCDKPAGVKHFCWR